MDPGLRAAAMEAAAAVRSSTPSGSRPGAYVPSEAGRDGGPTERQRPRWNVPDDPDQRHGSPEGRDGGLTERQRPRWNVPDDDPNQRYGSTESIHLSMLTGHAPVHADRAYTCPC